MPEILNKLDYWSDRITDRLMRRLPGPRIHIPTSRPMVSFTFDDVPDTALTNGAHILESHGVRGTFYIAGSLEGQVEPKRTLISRDGCRALAQQGHEIGCHTFSHTKVSHMGRQRLSADLQQNKDYLDAIDPRDDRRNFAYPYNAGSLWGRGIFQKNFQTCRSGGERINRGSVNPVFLSGVEIRQPESHALGLTGWIDTLISEPGWLIFFTHDIAAQPTDFGCTPETFERLVAYTLERGCMVLPVKDALDQFSAGRPLS